MKLYLLLECCGATSIQPLFNLILAVGLQLFWPHRWNRICAADLIRVLKLKLVHSADGLHQTFLQLHTLSLCLRFLPPSPVLWGLFRALRGSSALTCLTGGSELPQWWRGGGRVGASWWWKAALRRSFRIWRMMAVPLWGRLMWLWLQEARVPYRRRRCSNQLLFRSNLLHHVC